MVNDSETHNPFHPIDQIFAEHLAPDCHKEVSYFLSYLLKAAREGHLCISIENHSLHPSLSPELDPKIIAGAKSIDSSPLMGKYLIKSGQRYYLQRNWATEQRFLTHLKRLTSHPPSLTIPTEWLEKELDHQNLQKEQREAIIQAAKNSVTLICGGPGTGKTYTASVLIRTFLKKISGECIVAAPTGKATANIRKALGDLAEKCTIKTLHSILHKEKLYADLILVDEGSMVDADLMAKLFLAIPSGVRLILLGDHNQLPPVESGNFFFDLAHMSQFARLKSSLTTCLRAELKTIIDMAEMIKKGEPVPYFPLPDPKQLVQLIVENQMYVLTPLRKGPYGVEALNQALYKENLLLGSNEIPIMIQVNDPALELYNGDTGVLNKRENKVYFPSGRIYPESILPHYEYAYVLSVHKSQGSEYDRVMILLPEGAETFGREMLYTAITRAKKEVVIYSDQKTLYATVSNYAQRFSGIAVSFTS